jgi:hypothetical protein
MFSMGQGEELYTPSNMGGMSFDPGYVNQRQHQMPAPMHFGYKDSSSLMMESYGHSARNSFEEQ